MKALVLGASGFLGSYLGFALPRKGWGVEGVSRSPLDFFPHHLEVDSGEQIESVIAGSNAEVVINALAMASHEACQESPLEAYRVNQEWPGEWAATAGRRGQRFVHISTDAVFSGDQMAPYREDDPTGPTGVYGRSKLAGEAAVLAANPEALVVRTNFFGWSRGSDYGILDFFVRSFRDARTITGFDDYIVSSLYVGDLADAIVSLVEAGSTGVFHAVAADAHSKYDFGVEVASMLGLDSSVMSRGSLADASDMAPRGRRLELDTGRIEAELGRPMPSLREGLERALAERSDLMEYFGTTEGGGAST